MVANILLADPSLTLGAGSKGQNSTFQNMLMLHIKLKGMMQAAAW